MQTRQEKRVKDTSAPLAMYDITIKAGLDIELHTNQILDFMRTQGKKWAFQLEKGESTDYIHYQCRISLETKKRLSTMTTLCLNHDAFSLGFNVSPTSNPVTKNGDMFYVMKTDTRILGPWTSNKDNHVDVSKICEDYRFSEPEGGWKPWQKWIMETIDGPVNKGVVYVIINPGGSVGKTLLCNWLEARGKVVQITPGSDVERIPRQVMNEKKVGAYIVDMPKTNTGKVSANFWTGLELTAGGRCCDDRYTYRKEIFNHPHIFLFTNNRVDKWALTGNRWVFLTINKFYEIGKIEDQEYAFMIEQPKRLGRNDGKICEKLNLPTFDPENMRQTPILNIITKDNPTYTGLAPTKYECPLPKISMNEFNLEPEVTTSKPIVTRDNNKTILKEIKIMLAQMDEDIVQVQTYLRE